MASKSSDHRTTDRVAEKAHEAVDRTAEQLSHAEEKAREHLSDADERIRETARHGRDRGEDLVASVSTYVRDNPFMAVGVAFVAGALYASMTRRR